MRYADLHAGASLLCVSLLTSSCILIFNEFDGDSASGGNGGTGATGGAAAGGESAGGRGGGEEGGGSTDCFVNAEKKEFDLGDGLGHAVTWGQGEAHTVALMVEGTSAQLWLLDFDLERDVQPTPVELARNKFEATGPLFANPTGVYVGLPVLGVVRNVDLARQLTTQSDGFNMSPNNQTIRAIAPFNGNIAVALSGGGLGTWNRSDGAPIVLETATCPPTPSAMLERGGALFVTYSNTENAQAGGVCRFVTGTDNCLVPDQVVAGLATNGESLFLHAAAAPRKTSQSAGVYRLSPTNSACNTRIVPLASDTPPSVLAADDRCVYFAGKQETQQGLLACDLKKTGDAQCTVVEEGDPSMFGGIAVTQHGLYYTFNEPNKHRIVGILR